MAPGSASPDRPSTRQNLPMERSFGLPIPLHGRKMPPYPADGTIA